MSIRVDEGERFKTRISRREILKSVFPDIDDVASSETDGCDKLVCDISCLYGGRCMDSGRCHCIVKEEESQEEDLY
jgi:hypothetical protein